jgi:hypothetical protein
MGFIGDKHFTFRGLVEGFEQNKVGRCLELCYDMRCSEKWGVDVIASFSPVSSVRERHRVTG